MGRITTTCTLLCLALAMTLAGCGGGGGSSKAGSASTTAPVGSSATAATISFRSLERGEQSGYQTQPATQGAQLVLDTEAALDPVLAAHQGKQTPTRLNVDWTRERVVALFLGERPTGGHSIQVTGVAQVDSQTVEVEYRHDAPQGAAVTLVTHPYELVALRDAKGAVRFVDVTPATPPSTPGRTLSAEHGTLVEEALRAGAGVTLAFLPDGASDALELTDPSALVSAGAGAGSTLVLSGQAETNPAGATALGERVRVQAFTLDGLALTGQLEAVTGGAIFRDTAGDAYELIGPEAAAALASPVGRPLRITGTLDLTHVSTLTTGPGLTVSSFHAATIVALEVKGGLTGLDQRYAVEDVLVSGAARFTFSLVIDPLAAKRGRTTLRAQRRRDLAALVAAANLRAQPDRFLPPAGSPVVADVPLTILELQDAQGGPKRIEVRFNSQPPAAVQALIQELQAEGTEVPTFRALEQGSSSQIGQAGVRVARDAAELTALWNAHTGGGVGAPAQPTVDWTKEIVVAVFMGRQPTGGYAIELARLEGRGQDLHAPLLRTRPAPGAIVTQVITSPFQLVAVERKAAAASLWVDGAKQP
ncbi:MAG: protease complex subunit PrcB family protein [Planctomycetota bacterium]